MFERVEYPEQLGVSSEAFKELIEYFEHAGARIDSLMVVRHGKIACECHWAPATADTPHELFSLSKSITAIAMGFAVEEGYVDLDTKVYEKYFPHKLKELKGKQKEYAEKLTVHHVIAMQVGKITSVLDNKEKTDWIDSLLDRPFKFEPGTDWAYISENAFLLSWIIQKETGMTMTEFLTPRLYEPLGMKVPQWDQNRHGVDAGGWGLKLTALDIAKISYMFMNKGMYGDKRIISEDWINRSITPHNKKLYPIFSLDSHYGYQTWIDYYNNQTSYRFTGLYGQHSYMLPEYDAVVLMTARDNRDKILIDPVFDRIPGLFIEPCKLSDDKAQAFKAYVTSKKVSPEFTDLAPRSIAKEKIISGRKIKVISGANLSVIGAPTFFMWRERIGKLNDIIFNFNSDGLEFSFVEQGCERNTIKAGMNGEYIHNEFTMRENTIICDAQATWRKDGKLELFLYNAGRAQTRRFIFDFGSKIVKIKAESCPGYKELAVFNLGFTNGIDVKENGPISKGLDIGIPYFNAFYADPDGLGIFEK